MSAPKSVLRGGVVKTCHAIIESGEEWESRCILDRGHGGPCASGPRIQARVQVDDSEEPRPPRAKPGHRTTEFAVTILTTAGAVAAAVAGVLPAPMAATVAAAGAVAYALSRGLAKLGRLRRRDP